MQTKNLARKASQDLRRIKFIEFSRSTVVILRHRVGSSKTVCVELIEVCFWSHYYLPDVARLIVKEGRAIFLMESGGYRIPTMIEVANLGTRAINRFRINAVGIYCDMGMRLLSSE